MEQVFFGRRDLAKTSEPPLQDGKHHQRSEEILPVTLQLPGDFLLGVPSEPRFFIQEEIDYFTVIGESSLPALRRYLSGRGDSRWRIVEHENACFLLPGKSAHTAIILASKLQPEEIRLASTLAVRGWDLFVFLSGGSRAALKQLEMVREIERSADRTVVNKILLRSVPKAGDLVRLLGS